MAERAPLGLRAPSDRETPEWAVRPMVLADIGTVREIDRLSFPNPWPESTYRFEILENPSAHLLVITVPQEGGAARVVGFAGYWFVVDEAHISTLAVHPAWRGHGLGEVLLRSLLADALGRGARTVTLEVRDGNRVAQSLYRRYGFVEVGKRHAYYSDNGEDALLMTVREPRLG